MNRDYYPGDLQYISDTLLIEELCRISIILDRDKIKKEAQLSSILSGAASAIQNEVTSKMDTSSTGALIKSVLKFLEPGFFFKIHWSLGLISTVASIFGYSVTDILSSIISSLMPKITSGTQLTNEDVNRAGLSLVSSASVDMLSPLRQMKKNGGFVKNAQRRTQSLGGDIFPSKGTPLLYRAFGVLNQRNRKRLLVGWIVWAIKTILLSAGLLTAGGAVKNLFKQEKKEKPTSVLPTTSTPAPTSTTSILPNNILPTTPPARSSGGNPVGLKPSGKGQRYHANDLNTAWLVPVIGNDVTDTLLAWSVEIYPQLQGYEDIIEGDSSFRRTVSLLNRGYDGSDLISMPPGFNRRIDVVNQYAKDVWNQIRNYTQPQQ